MYIVVHVHDGQIGYVINRGNIAPPCAGHGKVAPRFCLGVNACFYIIGPEGVVEYSPCSRVYSRIPCGHPKRIWNPVPPRQASGLPSRAPQSRAHHHAIHPQKRGIRAGTSFIDKKRGNASLRPGGPSSWIAPGDHREPGDGWIHTVRTPQGVTSLVATYDIAPCGAQS